MILANLASSVDYRWAPWVFVSENLCTTPVEIPKPYPELFGCGHKSCLKIVKRKGIELVRYYFQEDDFTDSYSNKIFTQSSLMLHSSLALKFLISWVTFKIARNWDISLNVLLTQCSMFFSQCSMTSYEVDPFDFILESSQLFIDPHPLSNLLRKCHSLSFSEFCYLKSSIKLLNKTNISSYTNLD